MLPRLMLVRGREATTRRTQPDGWVAPVITVFALSSSHFFQSLPAQNYFWCSRTVTKLGLVEEFIIEIEGASKNSDVTRWGRFVDIKDVKKEMLQRVETQFENWLNS